MQLQTKNQEQKVTNIKKTLHGTEACGKLQVVSVAQCNCQHITTNCDTQPKAKKKSQVCFECLWKHHQKSFSSFISIFHFRSTGTELIVLQLSIECCVLFPPPHAKLQEIVTITLLFLTSWGSFFFFFTLTYCSSCKWYSACPGVQTLVCLSCSPRQHILLFKAFPRKEKQEAKFIPQLNLPVTNCTHGCRAMSQLQFTNKGRTRKDTSPIFC